MGSSRMMTRGFLVFLRFLCFSRMTVPSDQSTKDQHRSLASPARAPVHHRKIRNRRNRGVALRHEGPQLGPGHRPPGLALGKGGPVERIAFGELAPPLGRPVEGSLHLVAFRAFGRVGGPALELAAGRVGPGILVRGDPLQNVLGLALVQGFGSHEAGEVGEDVLALVKDLGREDAVLLGLLEVRVDHLLHGGNVGRFVGDE